jgi:hypothetical protein
MGAAESLLGNIVDVSTARVVLGAAFCEDGFQERANRLGIVPKAEVLELVLRERGYCVYWDVIDHVRGWAPMPDRLVPLVERAFRNGRLAVKWTRGDEDLEEAETLKRAVAEQALCINWQDMRVVNESTCEERALERKLVQWQYERSAGCWVAFDETAIRRIEAVFTRLRPLLHVSSAGPKWAAAAVGAETERVTINGYAYALNVATLTMKNLHPQFRSRPEYQIRRLEGGRGVEDGDEIVAPAVQWYLERTDSAEGGDGDEDGGGEEDQEEWEAADADLNRILEDHFSRDRVECQVDVAVPTPYGVDSCNYSVDWGRFEFVKTEDGTKRRLRREAGSYAHPQHDGDDLESSIAALGAVVLDDVDGPEESSTAFLEDVDRIRLLADRACDAVVAAHANDHDRSESNGLSQFAPEDPREFWLWCFPGRKAVGYTYFLQMFEHHFMPKDGDSESKLSGHERAALVAILDRLEPKRSICLAEFKFFCEKCAASTLPCGEFVAMVSEVDSRC